MPVDAMHGERLHFDMITATARDAGGANCTTPPTADWVDAQVFHIDNAMTAVPDTPGPDVEFDWTNLEHACFEARGETATEW